MRVRPWTLVLLLSLLASGLSALSCGGGSNGGGQLSLKDIPTATLPKTLPDPLIVSGTPGTSTSGKYVVKAGDNPSSIANQFGITTDQLMTANGISDPTSLHAGDELVIPGVQNVLGQQATPRPTAAVTAAAATPTARPTAAPATPASGQQTYTVQAGDIPETIAQQFGITADQLMAANGITDPTSLQVGQVLIIPTPQPTATPAQ